MISFHHTNSGKKPYRIPITVKDEVRAQELCWILKSGSWKEKRCFLIGGGPSLLETHVQRFLEDHIKSRKELSIGTNKAFIWNPTLNYAMDISFYQLANSLPAWKEYKGIKVFLYRNRCSQFDEDVYIVRSLPKIEISFDLQKGIWPGNNSGFGALMLAVALGAKKIGLLGYDFYVEDNRTHWHEGYGAKPDIMETALHRFIRSFEEVEPDLQAHGIKVVNLNPKSELRCFPFSTIEEFLNE